MAALRTLTLRRLAAGALMVAILAAACSEGSSAGMPIHEGEPGSSEDMRRDPHDEISVDITYATLDGDEASLTDFGGRPIVLNFFAAWCTSCVSEMPGFEEVHRARHTEVTFVGMSEDLVASDSLDLIAELGITYHTGWDPTGRVLNSFRAFVMPTTVFITADGDVAHTSLGPLDRDDLEDLIDEHLV